MSDARGRRVLNAHRTPFLAYDLEGMDPGAVTVEHEHAGMEEFPILEGDLVDADGSVFGPGDFVSYESGTRHSSWTERGCLIAVFEWQRD